MFVIYFVCLFFVILLARTASEMLVEVWKTWRMARAYKNMLAKLGTSSLLDKQPLSTPYLDSKN